MPGSITLRGRSSSVSDVGGVLGLYQPRWGSNRDRSQDFSHALEVTVWSVTVPFTLGLGQRLVPVSARPMRVSQGGLRLCRSRRRCEGLFLAVSVTLEV